MDCCHTAVTQMLFSEANYATAEIVLSNVPHIVGEIFDRSIRSYIFEEMLSTSQIMLENKFLNKICSP